VFRLAPVSTFPGGTVTFLFSDIEGSTRLLEQLGDRYQEVHRDHRRILREHLTGAGGQEIDTQGDAFFFSFPRAKDGVAGAVSAQRALAEHTWPDGVAVKARMGLHTGEPTVGEEGYVGMDVVRAARICSAGHGGQVLLSETTRALVGNNLPEGVQVRDLGEAHLKDIQHERIFELSLDDQPGEFPPLKTAPAPEPDFEQLLEQQIQEKVRDKILAAFETADDPVAVGKAGSKLAVFGLAIVFLIALMIIAIILLVSWLF
jgi:class 3 adenylate cyclase